MALAKSVRFLQDSAITRCITRHRVLGILHLESRLILKYFLQRIGNPLKRMFIVDYLSAIIPIVDLHCITNLY